MCGYGSPLPTVLPAGSVGTCAESPFFENKLIQLGGGGVCCPSYLFSHSLKAKLMAQQL